MNAGQDAAILEALIPRAMSVLFPPRADDPLRHHTIGQIRLMRSLLDGSRTAGELGHIVGLSPSSLTQMTSRMIAAGLVSKSCDDQDRRVRKLSLTDAGRRLMESRREARKESAARILDKVDPGKRQELIALLSEIAEQRPQPAFALVEAVV